KITGLRNNKLNNKNQLESYLEWSGLEKNYWDKNIKSYSRGMRQRLGMAQAFAGDPKIVFLDEPLSNIDPLGREEFIQKIRRKREDVIDIRDTARGEKNFNLSDEIRENLRKVGIQIEDGPEGARWKIIS
ncbi:hypothetical protein LCGC14_1712430, partial [marine sediment metagenome]